MTFSGVAVPARVRARPGQREGLGLDRDRLLPGRLGGAARDRSSSSSAHRSARCSTCTLFRRPAFAGASIVAFSLSASMFSMFLYLTLYIQDVLGYGPLQAGLRFLPITLLSFVVAPLSGRLSVRMPVRLLLGAGLLLVCDRAADDDRRRRHLGLDRADPRLRPRRRRHRPDQPAARLDRGRGRATTPAAAWRRGSTTPSARSASRPASPASARSSSTRSRAKPSAALGGHGRRPSRDRRDARPARAGARLRRRQAASPRALPGPEHAALLHAYRVGFTGAFTTILLIAALIAFVGAIARAAARAREGLRRTRLRSAPGRGAPGDRRRVIVYGDASSRASRAAPTGV